MLKLKPGYLTSVRCLHLFQSKKLTKDVLPKITTHDLLQELGFIKQSQSGLVHWLPLGLRSLNKITGIIRSRMNGAGAHELSLSSLSPRSLWEATGRWQNTELFKLKDSKSAEYCLVATCEEEITSLMNVYVNSYKDLPLLVYQVTRKYRDEKRPRGGLLRGREFLMKDAYSFHGNSDDAVRMFDTVNGVYEQIFKDLKIPFASAWADSGNIGGDLSKEYHYFHESGEDILMGCNSCGQVSNVEKCSSFPEVDGTHDGNVSVRYALNKTRDTLVCIYFPAHRELNWNLVLDAMDHDVDTTLKDIDNDKIMEIFTEQNEDLMFANIIRVMDVRLNSRSNFPDFPLSQYLKSNFSQLSEYSIVNATEGEVCGSCEEGKLVASKSIEVGHTFYLGKKYSELLNAKYMTKENKEEVMEMGCYGIGVSRLVGAIAQVTRDELGLRWPSNVAPYKMSVCGVQADEKTKEICELLKNDYQDDLWVDTRDKVGLGRKIAQSHAIGIPLCIIAGKRHWPQVEIEARGKRWGPHNTWEDAHKTYGEEYSWSVETADGSVEKHLVHKDYVNKVVSILLRDM